jgi:hypothetical protein
MSYEDKIRILGMAVEELLASLKGKLGLLDSGQTDNLVVSAILPKEIRAGISVSISIQPEEMRELVIGGYEIEIKFSNGTGMTYLSLVYGSWQDCIQWLHDYVPTKEKVHRWLQMIRNLVES